MSLTGDRKFTLTVMCIVCFLIYIYTGYRFLETIQPDISEKALDILGQIYFWGSVIFCGTMAIQLVEIYSGGINQSCLIKTSIIGAIIIPLSLVVICGYGIAILIGVFLAAGAIKLL